MFALLYLLSCYIYYRAHVYANIRMLTSSVISTSISQYLLPSVGYFTYILYLNMYILGIRRVDYTVNNSKYI